jgi:hypothetical protein
MPRTKNPTRFQQKIFLTREARKILRAEAKMRKWELSHIVEYLLRNGKFPPLPIEGVKMHPLFLKREGEKEICETAN